jgi:hypothetical protein
MNRTDGVVVTVRGPVYTAFEEAAGEGATLVKVLPPARKIGVRCCGPSEVVGTLEEARIYRLSARVSRREAKHLPGVIRVRSEVLEHYNGEKGPVTFYIC